MIHAHVLNLSALENVIAFRFVQNALQVVCDIMSDLLIIEALEAFFIFFHSFARFGSTFISHLLELISLFLQLVDFFDQGVILVASLVLDQHPILGDARQT